jgi:hypothetical protein
MYKRRILRFQQIMPHLNVLYDRHSRHHHNKLCALYQGLFQLYLLVIKWAPAEDIKQAEQLSTDVPNPAVANIGAGCERAQTQNGRQVDNR